MTKKILSLSVDPNVHFLYIFFYITGLQWKWKSSDGVEHTMIESITSMYINDTKGVTFNNKTKYVQFYETNKLNESRMQSEALARGLQRMVPSQLLRLFTPYEFQKMVCGKETIDLGKATPNPKKQKTIFLFHFY